MAVVDTNCHYDYSEKRKVITRLSEKFVTRAASAIKALAKVMGRDEGASIVIKVPLRSTRDNEERTETGRILPAVITVHSKNLRTGGNGLVFHENESDYERFTSVLRPFFTSGVPRSYRGNVEDETVAFGNLLRLEESLRERMTESEASFTCCLEYDLSQERVSVSACSILLDLRSQNGTSETHVFRGGKTTDLASCVKEAAEEWTRIVDVFLRTSRDTNVSEDLTTGATGDDLAEYLADLMYEMRDSRWKQERLARKALRVAA